MGLQQPSFHRFLWKKVQRLSSGIQIHIVAPKWVSEIATLKAKSFAPYDLKSYGNIGDNFSSKDGDIVCPCMKVQERGKQSSTLYGNDIVGNEMKILKIFCEELLSDFTDRSILGSKLTLF